MIRRRPPSSRTAKSPTFSREPLVSDEEDSIAFCNTGHWASVAWFGLSEIQGKKNVSSMTAPWPNGLPIRPAPCSSKPYSRFQNPAVQTGGLFSFCSVKSFPPFP